MEGKTVLLPTGGGRGKKDQPYPTIVAGLTEIPPTGSKEVASSRDARGHYHAAFVYPVQEETAEQRGVGAFDLGIKTLAPGVNEQGRCYHSGGCQGQHWYNKQRDKIRSKRDRCNKESRRYMHLSPVAQRVSEQQRHQQKDGWPNASPRLSHRLVASTVVSGELSQRQMGMKDHAEKQRDTHRAVYNDWGLDRVVQMLTSKCVRAGKELVQVDERDTSKTCSGCGTKQDMPLWKRVDRCGYCRLVMDRDENSAINILRRYLARLGPHTHAA